MVTWISARPARRVIPPTIATTTSSRSGSTTGSEALGRPQNTSSQREPSTPTNTRPRAWCPTPSGMGSLKEITHANHAALGAEPTVTTMTTPTLWRSDGYVRPVIINGTGIMGRQKIDNLCGVCWLKTGDPRCKCKESSMKGSQIWTKTRERKKANAHQRNGWWCLLRGDRARPATEIWGRRLTPGCRNRGEGPASAQGLTMNSNVEDDKWLLHSKK